MIHLPIAGLADVIAGIVMALFTLSALLLTIVILMQEGKGGGLAGAFGGAGADAFGVKAGAVNKFTAWLGAAFLGLALLHAGLQQAIADDSIEDSGTTNIEEYIEPIGGGGSSTDDDADSSDDEGSSEDGGSEDGGSEEGDG